MLYYYNNTKLLPQVRTQKNMRGLEANLDYFGAAPAG